MAYEITMTEAAEAHFRSLSARERRLLEVAVQTKLTAQPTTPTRAIKRLRTNPLAEFELRAGDLRVLYNVEGQEVVLLVIGRKAGNALIVDGEEFYDHQDDSAQPPGEGSGGNPG